MVNGNTFVTVITLLQFGAAFFYARDRKFPEAVMFTCFAVSNIAIMWRNV